MGLGFLKYQPALAEYELSCIQKTCMQLLSSFIQVTIFGWCLKRVEKSWTEFPGEFRPPGKIYYNQLIIYRRIVYDINIYSFTPHQPPQASKQNKSQPTTRQSFPKQYSNVLSPKSYFHGMESVIVMLRRTHFSGGRPKETSDGRIQWCGFGNSEFSKIPHLLSYLPTTRKFRVFPGEQRRLRAISMLSPDLDTGNEPPDLWAQGHSPVYITVSWSLDIRTIPKEMSLIQQNKTKWNKEESKLHCWKEAGRMVL